MTDQTREALRKIVYRMNALRSRKFYGCECDMCRSLREIDDDLVALLREAEDTPPAKEEEFPSCARFEPGGSSIAPGYYCRHCGNREEDHAPVGEAHAEPLTAEATQAMNAGDWQRATMLWIQHVDTFMRAHATQQAEVADLKARLESREEAQRNSEPLMLLLKRAEEWIGRLYALEQYKDAGITMCDLHRIAEQFATQQAALRALDAKLQALDRFSINERDDMLQADTDGDLVSLASVRSELGRLLGSEPGEQRDQ